MMPVINPQHLLEQALALAAAPASGGAPRQVDLRRAISNAYYAVFHAILTEAADELIGVTFRHTIRYAQAYRSVDHGPLHDIFRAMKTPTPPNKLKNFVDSISAFQQIRKLAAAVVELQEKRHSADYDPLFAARMSDATAAITTARAALLILSSMNAEDKKTLIALIVFRVR